MSSILNPQPTAELGLAPDDTATIALHDGTGTYQVQLRATQAGTLCLTLRSPRPLRAFVDGMCVIDQPLYWRSFQRCLELGLVIGLKPDTSILRIEVGPRPRHPQDIDESSPSRNRDAVMSAVMQSVPDELQLAGQLLPRTDTPSAALHFPPGQFHSNRLVWQEVVVHPLSTTAGPPRSDLRSLAEQRPPAIRLRGEVAPDLLHHATTTEEHRAGLQHLYVPVFGVDDLPPPLRTTQDDRRVEPVIERVKSMDLTLESPIGNATLPMPVYEPLGRLAPRLEYTTQHWPDPDELLANIPEPILPPHWHHFNTLYRAAWRMLLGLVTHTRPESGFPCDRIATSPNFGPLQFVWDSSFTAMATAYAWRHLPAYAGLDVLYSRQSDGGYLHREHDGRDGLPVMWEPDFSPNPPLIAVAEWQLYQLTANADRLARVYPALAAHFDWLMAHRQLDDGTFWTTGLANGLDNSPSLGDGYPDLTAQMIQNAEILRDIAKLQNLDQDAQRFELARQAIGDALNAHLWSDELGFYSTSRKDTGGHNPNKVITGFWPLWAGVVPQDRVDQLAAQLLDPNAFWRHHPVPSLAADSPHYVSAGRYWLGSTWAPTNYATTRGFARAGRDDLAFKIALRHLQCMSDVFRDTGKIWENYAPDQSLPGSWSHADYCWSSLGPIAMLLEHVLGLTPDAPNRRLCWKPPKDQRAGVRRYPLGPATVELLADPGPDGLSVTATSDFAVDLELVLDQHHEVIRLGGGPVTRSFPT
ncbi:MAG: trehalase family glycosidase [Planctomycetota bacterium]